MAKRLILALVSAVLIAPPLPGGRAATTPHATTLRPLRTITLGMGYIPNVQFAPFYAADQRGYYRQAGLRVTFSYAGSPNLIQLVGAGNTDFAIADGTDALAAAGQGIPVTSVMTLYRRLPVAIFSLAGKNIRSVRDLRGKTIGIPGRYGALYTGLLAALRTAGLGPGDVTIRSINYTQVESVAAGKVDAAVGYSANEPVQLAALPGHYKVDTLQVGAVTGLVGAGVIAGHGLIARDPAIVCAFVQATLRGLADTIKDPRAAYTLARRVNGLTALRGAAADVQYTVLLRTIDFWHDRATRAHGLGYADPAQWQDSARTLRAIGQLPHPPASGAPIDNAFSAGSAKL
jgi:NitT/TauT family transport system substrate-binding protein